MHGRDGGGDLLLGDHQVCKPRYRVRADAHRELGGREQLGIVRVISEGHERPGKPLRGGLDLRRAPGGEVDQPLPGVPVRHQLQAREAVKHLRCVAEQQDLAVPLQVPSRQVARQPARIHLAAQPVSGRAGIAVVPWGVDQVGQLVPLNDRVQFAAVHFAKAPGCALPSVSHQGPVGPDQQVPMPGRRQQGQHVPDGTGRGKCHRPSRGDDPVNGADDRRGNTDAVKAQGAVQIDHAGGNTAHPPILKEPRVANFMAR